MSAQYEHLLRKSQDAKRCGHEAWTVQSTGERVAVALVLNRANWLAEINYTIAEAIEHAEEASDLFLFLVSLIEVSLHIPKIPKDEMNSVFQMANEMRQALLVANNILDLHNTSRTHLWYPRLSWAWPSASRPKAWPRSAPPCWSARRHSRWSVVWPRP